MDDTPNPLIEINPDHPFPPLTDAARAEIAALAARQKEANGVLMKAITYVGGQVEDRLKLLPPKPRGQIAEAARSALRQSFALAERSRRGSWPPPASTRCSAWWPAP